MISPDPLGILEKLLRGKQDEIVSLKQMVLPTENHFHHVVCYDRTLRNRPCKMKNEISISPRIGIALKIQA